MNLFNDAYRGKKIILTGHTGFKGSWLALWLQYMDANITGISLPPETAPSHWELLKQQLDDRREDIRNQDAISDIFTEIQPDIVFHLAAQPLVRRSYNEPIATLSANILGTAHVLEACRICKSVQAVVIVTTDKCYQNNEWEWGYREVDRLGGHDIYSVSKACAELVTQGYRCSFLAGREGPMVATARAGNVIGGGDWSEDRLIPDLVRAMSNSRSLEVRLPKATRPWQHVLDALCGYLLLGQRLIEKRLGCADAWNFGPDRRGNCTVSDVLAKLERYWSGLKWHVSKGEQPHEAGFLYLDSSKARNQLGWQPLWDIDNALQKTAEWYQAWTKEKKIISQDQLNTYIQAALDKKMEWAGH